MSAAPGSTSVERMMVVDEKNLALLWLEEKVARRQLTSSQADKMLGSQMDAAKLCVGPIKDGLETFRTYHTIAKDLGFWKGAKVRFVTSKAGNRLVIFTGPRVGKEFLTARRYRIDNPKIVELQIGKVGLREAGRKSARFGCMFVVAMDVMDYIVRDETTFGQLLGHLTLDIPAAVLATALGTAVASFISETAIVGLAAIGSLACGPFIVAFVVGVLVAVAIDQLDKAFKISELLGDAYDRGIVTLKAVWKQLDKEAEQRFRQLENSQMVHDLQQEAAVLAQKLARTRDRVKGRLQQL